MSFAAKSILKPVSMATNGCLTSYTASKASFSRPCVSIPFRPIKLHISCSYASSIPLSLKRKEPILRISVIAAQQEEGIPVLLEEQGGGEFNWAEGRDSDGDTDGFAPSEEAKLYVGNVPYDVDSETLAQVFEGAGTVEIVEIIGNRETGQSRGFGFVTMSTVEEADKAVEMFHRYDLNGRLLTVNKAARKGSRPPPRVSSEPRNRIYVGNLPWSADDARLEQLFSEYGKVVSARVVSDRETGRSRGFGFVVLSSEAEMNDAIANLDGHNLDGRAIRVNVAAVRPPRGDF